MNFIQSSLTAFQQNISSYLGFNSHNEALFKSIEKQISKDEKEFFFTLNNSKKIYDYLDNDTAFISIPQKDQQQLQQCIDLKSNEEFFEIFNTFTQSKEFNDILKAFITDLNLLKQLIGFYLKDDASCNTRQSRIDTLISALENTAEYAYQNPHNLLEMFSITRKNIHIIVAVISKLKTVHEIINPDTQQINNADITVDALTELIIEYCDMFDICWAGVSFRMLNLQQGLKHRLSGKAGIVCKVKNELLTALSTDTEQQLIAMGDRKKHPGMSVHVIAYLNSQVAGKFGIADIKDIYINDDKLNDVIPNNPNKPTDIQVQEYKKTADIVLSAYNINLNLASDLLDSFNTFIELYNGLKLGDDKVFSKEKINQIKEPDENFLFNDLDLNIITPTNLLYETTNNNPLSIYDLIKEETINGVVSYVFENILSKLQGFTAQALLPDESQRLIIDIPQELTNTSGNLAIAAIGSCYFWVVDKNQLAENQAVKLDLTKYIKLEVSHIPKNLVNKTDKYFYRSLVTQALQQTQDAQAIVDFIDRCDINEYLQQDAAFKQHINQIISNKIALNPKLKDQLIKCIFYNGNYIKNNKFKFSYANWFIESKLCEPLAMFFAENSIDITDFINQLSIKTMLQFDRKDSIDKLSFATIKQCTVAFDKKYFNALFYKLMEYGDSPVIIKLFESSLLIDLCSYNIRKDNYFLMTLIKNNDVDGINTFVKMLEKSMIMSYSVENYVLVNYCNNNLLNVAKYGKEAEMQAIINLNYIMMRLRLPPINRDKLNNAYITAAEYGNTEVLKYLVSLNTCNPNSQNEQGQTALMLACEKGNVECIKFSLQREDIDLNIKDSLGGNTALLLACYKNRIECVKLLLESGKDIDLNQLNFRSMTALEVAKLYKYTDCVKLLHEALALRAIPET